MKIEIAKIKKAKKSGRYTYVTKKQKDSDLKEVWKRICKILDYETTKQNQKIP